MASKGLVGFFDILGYQSIIDNNSIDEVSRLISDVMLQIPDKVRETLCRPHRDKKANFEFLSSMVDRLEARLISDSIVLTFPIKKRHKYRWEKLFSFFMFTQYVDSLMSLTFREGLPLRGAIGFGEFFLQDHCFAGKPIINCYRLGNSLDFSGCVMAQDCKMALDRLLKQNRDLKLVIDEFGHDYLCPLKDQKSKRLFLLKWSPHLKGNEDIRQAVFRTFKAHNKDIGVGVDRKLTHTEFILRFFQIKRTELAERRIKKEAKGKGKT